MLDWRALFVNLIMKKKIKPIVDIRGRAKSFSGTNLVAFKGPVMILRTIQDTFLLGS